MSQARLPRRRRAGVLTQSHIRVLFVDDEQGVLEALRHLVIDTDYMPMCASSGEEALQILLDGAVAVVISDYRMPGMTGVELLKRVHDMHPKTVRMILTGYAETHAVVEAINEGHVDKFLTKPWNDEEVLSALADGVRKYRLEVENERLYRVLQDRNRELQHAKVMLEKRVREHAAEIEAQNARLRLSYEILDRLPYALFGIDTNHVLVAVNQRGSRAPILLQPLELGDDVADSLPRELLDTVTEVLQTGHGASVTLQRQGRRHWAECVPLGQDQVRGVILLVREMV